MAWLKSSHSQAEAGSKNPAFFVGENMASLEEHCRECERKLGEPFPQVHIWLDEFFGKGIYKLRIEEHRRERHHQEGIEEVRRAWGQKAAEAARLHIITDMGVVLPRSVICKRLPVRQDLLLRM